MTNVCLGCGAERRDSVVSFICDACREGIDQPDQDHIAYWTIWLDDDHVFTVRAWAETPVGRQHVGDMVADSLPAAQALLPTGARLVSGWGDRSFQTGVIEVWAPTAPDPDASQ